MVCGVAILVCVWVCGSNCMAGLDSSVGGGEGGERVGEGGKSQTTWNYATSEN